MRNGSLAGLQEGGNLNHVLTSTLWSSQFLVVLFVRGGATFLIEHYLVSAIVVFK
jgi:hypothetical protein